jgi:hypothetical protein
MGAIRGTVVVRVRIWGGGRGPDRAGAGVPGEVGIIITVGTGVKVMGKIRVPPDAGIGVRVRAKEPVGGARFGVKFEMW